VRGLRPQIIVDESFKNVKVKNIAKASSAAYPFLAATEIKN